MEKLKIALGLLSHRHLKNYNREEASFKRWKFLQSIAQKSHKNLKNRKKKLKSHKVTHRDLGMIARIFKKSKLTVLGL